MSTLKRRVRAFAGAGIVACGAFFARSPAAQEPPTAPDAAIDPVVQAVIDSHVEGPVSVALRDEARLDLAADMVFVPRPAADGLMNMWGNTVDEAFVGLVLPTDDAPWFVTIDYVESGHIADGEAREWDTDELLESLRAGTREGNDWRASQGFAPIEVTGWIEQPQYDEAQRHLVWSAGVREIGAPSSDQDSVNYNTYVLGREGYLSMNLVTSRADIDSEKAIARGLLQATRFNPGRGYDDFDPGSDRVAAYGLAALVGGIAAKKLGLLAVAAAFLVKAWKLVILGLIGAGAVVRRLFRPKTAA